MSKRLVPIALILFLMQVIGCGAYYTKEGFYGAIKSDGWSIPFGDNQLSTFACERKSIRLMRNAFAVEKTSEAVLGVPVVRAKKSLKEPALNEKIVVRMEYRGSTGTCSLSDLTLMIDGIGIGPVGVKKYYEIPQDNVIYCEYAFDEEIRKVSGYSISFNKEIIGCDVKPLKMLKEVGSSYHFSPW